MCVCVCIDPHLQMSSQLQSVWCVFVFFSFSQKAKGMRAAKAPPPPKKRTAAAASSVDKMLWPTIKTARPRCPSIEILACQRVINSQINTNIKEHGIYTRSRRRALNSASFPQRSWERSVCSSLTSDTGIACIHFHPTLELCFSFIYAACLLEEFTIFCVVVVVIVFFFFFSLLQRSLVSLEVCCTSVRRRDLHDGAGGELFLRHQGSHQGQGFILRTATSSSDNNMPDHAMGTSVQESEMEAFFTSKIRSST